MFLYRIALDWIVSVWAGSLSDVGFGLDRIEKIGFVFGCGFDCIEVACAGSDFNLSCSESDWTGFGSDKQITKEQQNKDE